MPLEQVHETARIAIENGVQLCIHAIGDRANREVLDAYQAAFEAHPNHGDLRWRVEHAQHLHPDEIPRFAELWVIASMQSVHCTSDGGFMRQAVRPCVRARGFLAPKKGSRTTPRSPGPSLRQG